MQHKEKKKKQQPDTCGWIWVIQYNTVNYAVKPLKITVDKKNNIFDGAPSSRRRVT